MDGLLDLLDFTENGTTATLPYDNTEVEYYWRSTSLKSTLPVQLVDFYAEKSNCNALIKWTSAAEEDFNYYELEWSNTGNYFIPVKQINSAEGSGFQYYFYLHKNTANTNYYRLKMVDLDGSYSYSKTVKIQLDCNNEYDINVFPNPLQVTDGRVQLKFYSEYENTTAFLYAMDGKLLKTFNMGVELEWNVRTLELGNLAAGVYFIKLNKHRKAVRLAIME